MTWDGLAVCLELLLEQLEAIAIKRERRRAWIQQRWNIARSGAQAARYTHIRRFHAIPDEHVTEELAAGHGVQTRQLFAQGRVFTNLLTAENPLLHLELILKKLRIIPSQKFLKEGALLGQKQHLQVGAHGMHGEHALMVLRIAQEHACPHAEEHALETA
jgi:hypothetical protein